MQQPDRDRIEAALAKLDEQIRHLGSVIHGAEKAIEAANKLRTTLAALNTEPAR